MPGRVRQTIPKRFQQKAKPRRAAVISTGEEKVAPSSVLRT